MASCAAIAWRTGMNGSCAPHTIKVGNCAARYNRPRALTASRRHPVSGGLTAACGSFYRGGREGQRKWDPSGPLRSGSDKGRSVNDSSVSGLSAAVTIPDWRKVDELPLDFSRRLMSVIVETPQGVQQLICKGAPEEVFNGCTHFEIDGEVTAIDKLLIDDLRDAYESLSRKGFLLTQTLIIHVIRTNRIPFLQSRASVPLMVTTSAIMLVGVWLPSSALGPALGLTHLPPLDWPLLALTLLAYMALTQAVKVWLHRRWI